jgi:hypothetical protein
MQGEEIVSLNIPILRSTHDRLLEIRDSLRAANLSLALQRIISEYRIEESLQTGGESS